MALLAKATALPGVREAAITTGRDSTTLVIKEGEPIPPENRAATGSAGQLGLGELRADDRHVARRRPLVEEVETPGAMLINESLARRDFADVNPIGARLRCRGR